LGFEFWVSAERLGETTQSSKRQTQNSKLSSGSTAAGEPKLKTQNPKLKTKNGMCLSQFAATINLEVLWGHDF
jgi:hypothetical protein